MDLTFVYSPGFVREWGRLRLTEADLEALIGPSPTAAPVMRGTGGLRKIRFAPASMHRGKSGAMRVGFAHLGTRAAVVVVAIFSQAEASNFTAAERAEIAAWLRLFEGSFR